MVVDVINDMKFNVIKSTHKLFQFLGNGYQPCLDPILNKIAFIDEFPILKKYECIYEHLIAI